MQEQEKHKKSLNIYFAKYFTFIVISFFIPYTCTS